MRPKVRSETRHDDVGEAVEAVARLFPALYLRLHRRRPKGGHRADGQMMATLTHLAHAGPLTVGEAAAHLDRAQSVVSELVDRLCAHGWAERMPDARDRRRTLVWLTPAGEAAIREEQEVLSRELLLAALARTAPADRRALVRGMAALVEAAGTLKPARESRAAEDGR
ncbi:MAG: MarR family winged helix-turn-helix transcriptional regulator [Anaeromyxobacteraceae bacterium]